MLKRNSSFEKMLLLTLLLTISNHLVAADDTTTEEDDRGSASSAVLFPLFALILSKFSYYIITRYVPLLPHTAVMFTIGMIIGIAITVRDVEDPNMLTKSIKDYWLNIDSGLVLLLFLPGLLFKDSLDINVHLLQLSFVQCLIFAFPMLLAQACLIAVVFFYLFPFDWSFDFAMTMGAILTATDPVTIQLLLQQVGAPPRLQTHIGGEALLNDGSAIVFFGIFGSRYLFEFGIPGVGEDLDLGESIRFFCRQIGGGIGIGAGFSIGLMGMLWFLRRRLNEAENVVQVASTFTMAFLCFYVAEDLAGTSGVVADVTLGIMTEALGRHLYNDRKLLQDFWSIIDGAEDTIIFTLGGLFFGAIVAVRESDNDAVFFTGTEWGYTILLYVFVMIIRFLVFALALPITSRIGLKSTWQEMVFQAYSAMRGELGISLSIALVNSVKSNSQEETRPFERQTNTLFGFVAGTTFLTLVINGTTAPFLLRCLRLDDSVKIREQMLSTYSDQYRPEAVENMVRLLAQRRFGRVNYAVIRHHVPMLANLERYEVLQAANRYHKGREDVDTHQRPRLHNILPYLDKPSPGDEDEIEASEHGTDFAELEDISETLARPDYSYRRTKSRRNSKKVDINSIEEVRRLFVELLRLAYEEQIESGELTKREYITQSLKQSLDFSAVEVFQGGALNDWDSVILLKVPWNQALRNLLERDSKEYTQMRMAVELSIAFIYAHKSAQTDLKEVIQDEDSKVRQLMLEESQVQVDKAIDLVSSYDKEDVQLILSHKFCKILLNNAVKYVEDLAAADLLKDRQAHEYLQELEKSLREVDACQLYEHPDELPLPNTSQTQLPPNKKSTKKNSVMALLAADESETSRTTSTTEQSPSARRHTVSAIELSENAYPYEI